MGQHSILIQHQHRQQLINNYCNQTTGYLRQHSLLVQHQRRQPFIYNYCNQATGQMRQHSILFNINGGNHSLIIIATKLLNVLLVCDQLVHEESPAGQSDNWHNWAWPNRLSCHPTDSVSLIHLHVKQQTGYADKPEESVRNQIRRSGFQRLLSNCLSQKSQVHQVSVIITILQTVSYWLY